MPDPKQPAPSRLLKDEKFRASMELKEWQNKPRSREVHRVASEIPKEVVER